MFAKRTFCPRKGRFVHRGNAKLFAQISGTISTIYIVLTETKCELSFMGLWAYGLMKLIGRGFMQARCLRSQHSVASISQR